MTAVTLDTHVGQLVADRPSRALLFERLGIDYCCGGRLPLRDACAGKGLVPEAVLRELVSHDQTAPTGNETDWASAPFTALADHIVATYHDPLRNDLPRLALLIDKVRRAHGENHPELTRLQTVFDSFQGDLELHMLKEERVLFPLFRQLDTARTRPTSPCGSLEHPIGVMISEHEHAGDELAAMRELTHNFTPPADACTTYRVMLDGLAEVEREMHHHVHLENNILFPRAAALEATLAAG